MLPGRKKNKNGGARLSDFAIGQRQRGGLPWPIFESTIPHSRRKKKRKKKKMSCQNPPRCGGGKKERKKSHPQVIATTGIAAAVKKKEVCSWPLLAEEECCLCKGILRQIARPERKENEPCSGLGLYLQTKKRRKGREASKQEEQHGPWRPLPFGLREKKEGNKDRHIVQKQGEKKRGGSHNITDSNTTKKKKKRCSTASPEKMGGQKLSALLVGLCVPGGKEKKCFRPGLSRILYRLRERTASYAKAIIARSQTRHPKKKKKKRKKNNTPPTSIISGGAEKRERTQKNTMKSTNRRKKKYRTPHTPFKPLHVSRKTPKKPSFKTRK